MVPILYEDNHILVINKPAGLLSQGDGKRDNLVDILKKYIKESAEKNGNVYLGGIHRLDAPVSGMMVFAKTSKAASRLSEMLKQDGIKKIYLAISRSAGNKDYDKEWKHFRGSFERPTTITTIYPDNRSGKSVEHYYRRITGNGDQMATLIHLISGRKHQIRGFMKSIQLPIVGDSAYGGIALKSHPEAILLHSIILSFIHPVRKQELVFTAPLPPYFPDWLKFNEIIECIETHIRMP